MKNRIKLPRVAWLYLILSAILLLGWIRSCSHRDMISYGVHGPGDVELESNRGGLYFILKRGEFGFTPIGWYWNSWASAYWEQSEDHHVRRWMGIQVFTYVPHGAEKSSVVVVISYWLPLLFIIVLFLHRVRREGNLRRADEVSGGERLALETDKGR